VIKQAKRVGWGVQITSQLPAPYPQPHRGHPTAKISSMNGSQPPFKFEEPARWGFLFAWFLTAFFSTPE
jgi:hypothetical protein